MIYMYTGTPGSGKSLHSAYDIINRLKRGKTVIANFPIDMNWFKKKPKGTFIYIPFHEMTPKVFKDFAKCHHKLGREGQTLVIIDECAVLFNCRNWNVQDRLEWIFLFQIHRKLGYNFCLITQNDKLIDKQIRAFVETEYKHRAIKHYKTFGSMLSLFSGGLFIAIEYWYGTHLKCGSEFFRFSKKKAKIYDTNLLFE